jgi:trigger factor
MDIKTKETSKNQRQVEVTISLEEMKKYLDKAIETMSLEKPIKGFRPGKAPKKMIEEKFGKQTIWQEACNEAVKNTYLEAIEEKGFSVVASPEVQIESMEIDKPLSYKIILEVLPDIVLPDYKKIGKEIMKEKKEIKVENKEVDKTLKTIQSSRAKVKLVNREAEKGDEIIIDFQGSIDGVKQEGLKAEKTRVILGEEQLVKGFEEQIIGLKAGDLKNFSLEMDFRKSDEKTVKKQVEFNVKVHSVNEREIPELNDEFAKSLGQFSDLNNLKEKIKENIKAEKEHKEKERVRMKTLEAVMEKTSAEIPKTMIDREVENMINELKTRLSESGLSFEEYLRRTKKTEDDFKEESRLNARKRILMGLVLQEIIKKEKIEVTEQELEKETNDYLNKFYNQKPGSSNSEEVKAYIKNMLINEKVFKLLGE